MINAQGYAILVKRGPTKLIDVDTICATARGAKINYIAKRHSILMFDDDTDETIEKLWKLYGQESECVKVNIEVAK